jgi:hypothetical protein
VIDAQDLALSVALNREWLIDRDPPVVVVDLETARDAPLPAGLTSMPVVLVGLGDVRLHGEPLAQVLDVLTDDPAVLRAVEHTVRTAPRAAVSAALLLRRQESSVESALVAESSTYSMLQAGPEFAAWLSGRHAVPAEVSGHEVLVDRVGAEFRITLNRPERHNAYSSAMRDQLVAALEVAVSDPTLRVVLAGAGPSFSSGGDLAEFGSFADPVSAHLVRLTRSAALLLALIGDRVEVHLHGACLGAGIELAAFARTVVAREGTRLGLPEVPLGLVPGAGGTVSLPRRIGRHRTAQLMLTAEPIDEIKGLEWGLVDEIE